MRSILVLILFALGCRATERGVRPPFYTLDDIDGLEGTARVVVDLHGIPHIYAASLADAAFVLGWYHARDRFLQMDLGRRAGLGRLAEILGPAALDEDRYARTLGLNRAAEASWRLVPARERKIVENYTAGVNKFLRETPSDRRPAFYRQNKLEPEPWRPVDCFAIHKRFTAELSHSFDDVFLQLVEEKLGREAVETLFPEERDARVPAVRHPRSPEFIMRLRQASGRDATSDTDTKDGLASACEDILRRFPAPRPRIAGPGGHASNAWAVSGELTRSGMPILCGDPHLGLSHPGVFYTAHLVSPGLSVIGVTIPGVPVVVFGHNGSIAWTATNAQADVTDFFVEELDPEDSDRYRHRGRWLRVRSVEEKIAVLGQAAERLVVRRTVHGPIVTERGKTLSMKWQGERGSTEIVAYLRLNAARDLQGFLDALRSFVAPALTFVYADRAGHIAIRPSGEIPRRTRGVGRFPQEGASGNYEWLSPIPFEEMPFSVDPPQGYVLTANQRLAPLDFPHYLGWEYDPSFRARRLDELLRASNRFTPERLRDIQLDSVDVALRELLPLLVAAFGEERPNDPIADLALRHLRAWDSNVVPHSVEATVAWTWLEIYANAVWIDDWERAQLPRSGNWGFCSNGWRPPLDVLVELSSTSKESPWFDDVRTEETEDRDAIMRRSFLQAIEKLAAEFGPGYSSWTWGRRNVMMLPDLLRTPDGGLDLGPVPGNANTVGPGGEGGVVTSGAVFRMVLPLADLSRAIGASPGIQARPLAGLDLETQARLQAQAYLRGYYLPLSYHSHPGEFDEEEVAEMYMMSPRWKSGERRQR